MINMCIKEHQREVRLKHITINIIRT